MEKLLNNYCTKNMTDDACRKDWFIAPVPSKVQQVKVQLNDGKSYDYACRYAASEDSVAVIGWEFPELNSDSIDPSVNSGAMGHVNEVLPKLTIKRSRAVEIDYIFNCNPAKKDLTQCVKYLKLDSYKKTLQFEKELTPIRPISYHIRRVLAAASILAYPKFVSEEDLELAKATIFEFKTIDDKMSVLTTELPEYVGVALSDVHTPNANISKTFEQITLDVENDENWMEGNGDLGFANNILKKFAKLESVSNFVNKYAHFGAVSLMVRGGFVNLLNAYLSVNPPIAEFHDEMCQVLDGVGHKEAFEVLKAYGN